MVQQSFLLPMSLEAPAMARRAVDDVVPEHPRLSDIELMTSELVANAVQHSGMPADEPILLTMGTGGGWVRVEVHDAGMRVFPDTDLRPPGTPLSDSSFGLKFVSLLASDWGVSTAGHTSVWFEVE